MDDTDSTSQYPSPGMSTPPQVDATEVIAQKRNEERIQQSREEVWYLKEISFCLEPGLPSRQFKIVTQNFNGPCSFIAICNILILRDKIQILPYERASVSYDYLSQLVAEYLLLSCPEVDISAALSIMPATRKGMDLNPLFGGSTSFRPAGLGGELKLFDQAGIKLVHGWLVDPTSPEHAVLSRMEDYDTSVNLLVEVDHLTKGHFVVSESSSEPSSSKGPSRRHSVYNLTSEEQQKVEDALLIRNYIENAPTQLTYYGLFNLGGSLEPHCLVALFRNSHLSVLYKSPGEESALYTLVTDQVFLHEPSVVWERLEDIDGGWSTFVDSDFVRSSPAGGDYAGQTAESALAVLEGQAAALTLADRADEELARQLQAEEYDRSNQLQARRARDRVERDRTQDAARQRPAKDATRPKKKSDCVIM